MMVSHFAGHNPEVREVVVPDLNFDLQRSERAISFFDNDTQNWFDGFYSMASGTDLTKFRI